jgi:hypothetical protein
MKTTKKWNKLFLVGLLGVALTIGLTLVGCEDSNSDSGGGGGCGNPNKTCWKNSDTDFSFCGSNNCSLAYDYTAKCNC